VVALDARVQCEYIEPERVQASGWRVRIGSAKRSTVWFADEGACDIRGRAVPAILLARTPHQRSPAGASAITVDYPRQVPFFARLCPADDRVARCRSSAKLWVVEFAFGTAPRRCG